MDVHSTQVASGTTFHSTPGSTTSSPASARVNTNGRKRKLSVAGLVSEGSPGSNGVGEEDDDENDDRRKQPGVKRACNECRQQKLRCNVIQEPVYQPCTRCQRLKLDCRIDANFKRVGKRSKNAEMEREIVELRKRLGQHQEAAVQSATPSLPSNTAQESPMYEGIPNNQDQYLGSHEAVASLLDLKQGLGDGVSAFGTSSNKLLKSLEDVVLHQERIDELFQVYFTYFHPFLPLLEPERTPNYYYDLSPLLFWTVISIAARRFSEDSTLLTRLTKPLSAMLWSKISGVPQKYHTVKALCLLCTWPLPTSTTSKDPTFMLSGIIIQLALQTGLHRPSHAQDFSRYHVELRDEDIRDRLKTWAVCNIVAQSVSTGYGQPACTVYDWTLTSQATEDNYTLPQEIYTRLRIERFADSVTRTLYLNQGDPLGRVGERERSAMIAILAENYADLQNELGPSPSPIDSLHLQAVGLHLRLSAFFDPSTAASYRSDLLSLYLTTCRFLDTAHNLALRETGPLLRYATNYLMQMILAAGFTLLKLLNSFFASHVNLADGRALFTRTIDAVRQISVVNNDLPQRLAEVLAQLWKASVRAAKSARPRDHSNSSDSGIVTNGISPEIDNTLQLKVRCRMSMSLLFDSVWRWREEFQNRGSKGNLDSAVKNPTILEVGGSAEQSGPDSEGGMPSSSPDQPRTQLVDGTSYIPRISQQNPLQQHQQQQRRYRQQSASSSSMQQQALQNSAAAAGPMLSGVGMGLGYGAMGENNYEVFDPLNWVLDGFIDFPNAGYAGGETFDLGGL